MKTRAQQRRYRWWNRNRCPHVVIYGLYGDVVNVFAKGRRLFCPDCRRFLDGPVSLPTEVFPPLAKSTESLYY